MFTVSSIWNDSNVMNDHLTHNFNKFFRNFIKLIPLWNFSLIL